MKARVLAAGASVAGAVAGVDSGRPAGFSVDALGRLREVRQSRGRRDARAMIKANPDPLRISFEIWTKLICES